MEHNYIKNKNNYINIENIPEEMDFIHSYKRFYITSKDVLNHFLENMRENYCSLLINKSKNGKYIVLIIENHIGLSVYYSLDIIYEELKSLYPDINPDNLFLSDINKRTTTYSTEYYRVDEDSEEDISYCTTNFSLNKHSEICDYKNSYSEYLKSLIPVENNIEYFVDIFNDNEEVKKYLLNGNINKDLAPYFLMFHLYNAWNGFDEFTVFLFDFIEKNKINPIEDKRYFYFLNEKLLTYKDFNFEFLKDKTFFIKEHLNIISEKSLRNFNREDLLELDKIKKIANF